MRVWPHIGSGSGLSRLAAVTLTWLEDEQTKGIPTQAMIESSFDKNYLPCSELCSLAVTSAARHTRRPGQHKSKSLSVAPETSEGRHHAFATALANFIGETAP